MFSVFVRVDDRRGRSLGSIALSSGQRFTEALKTGRRFINDSSWTSITRVTVVIVDESGEIPDHCMAHHVRDMT